MLEQLHKVHDRRKEEGKDLREKVSGLSKRKQLLVSELSESLCCQDELKKLNQDLHIKADDTIGRRLEVRKELEEVVQFPALMEVIQIVSLNHQKDRWCCKIKKDVSFKVCDLKR